MKLKLIITSFMLVIMNVAVFCQFDGFNSFRELHSIGKKYLQENELDSAILVYEYARNKFPTHDKYATYLLDYLYLLTNQDSKSLGNWDYGLEKGYFFGLSLEKDRFESNPEFDRLAKRDKQVGDSLSNLAHVEYEVVLPKNYSSDKEYPILFVFHGNNRNLQQSKPIWTSDVVKETFIAVYLQSYIYMSKSAYQWKLGDEKTNKEFKEIYEQVINDYPIKDSKIVFCGMSKGCSIAIDYAFNQFVPVSGLVLNCPVIPNVRDSSINAFIDKNKKIAIITGEYDWALKSQKNLINKIDSLEGNSKMTINERLGHQFARDFSTILDGYLSWVLE